MNGEKIKSNQAESAEDKENIAMSEKDNKIINLSELEGLTENKVMLDAGCVWKNKDEEIPQEVKNGRLENENAMEWHALAKIFDRLLLITFPIATCITCALYMSYGFRRLYDFG